MIKLNKLDKPNTIYAEVIEDGALTQFITAMEQHFTVRGALMPDAHLGYTLPIGAVIETEGVVYPSYVGFDIGCGVCALPLSCRTGDIKHKAHRIYEMIKRNVPVGFNKHKNSVKESYNFLVNKDNCTKTMHEIYHNKNGDLQLGTLGGGKMTASSPRG